MIAFVAITKVWYISFLGVFPVFFVAFMDDLELIFRPIVLSKKICSGCLENYGWGACEDINWRSNKEIYCLGCHKRVRTDSIPKGCKYKLEHLVLK